MPLRAGRSGIAYGSDPQQFAELRRPAGTAPVPVVVVVHGGFWLSQYDLGLMLPVCEALTRDGFATWNVEYRRLYNPGGDGPTPSSTSRAPSTTCAPSPRSRGSTCAAW